VIPGAFHMLVCVWISLRGFIYAGTHGKLAEFVIELPAFKCVVADAAILFIKIRHISDVILSKNVRRQFFHQIGIDTFISYYLLPSVESRHSIDVRTFKS